MIDELTEKSNNEIDYNQIPKRLHEILKNSNVYNVGDLISFDFSSLATERQVGYKSIADFKEYLISFAKSPDEIKNLNNNKIKSHNESFAVLAPVKELLTNINNRIKNIFSSSFNEYTYDELDSAHSEQYSKIIDKYRALVRNITTERMNEIFSIKYFADERITLQDCGEKFELTRERIRQICNQVLKSMNIKYKKIVNTNNSLMFELLTIFNNMTNEELCGLFIYMHKKNPDTILLLKNTFFTEIKEDKIEELARELKTHHIYYTKVKEKLAVKEARFWDGVEWSENLKTISQQRFDEIKTLSEPSEFLIKIADEIKSFENIIDVKLLPKINVEEAYMKMATMAILNNQYNIAFIRIVPNLNICGQFNIKNYIRLKEFAIQYGFGYGLITNRYNSMKKILSMEKNPEFEVEFLKIANFLDNRLRWVNVKDIKNDFNVSTNQFYNTILSNGFFISQKPFRIYKE